MKQKIIAAVLTLLLTQSFVYADGVLIECEETTMNIKVNSIPETFINHI